MFIPTETLSMLNLFNVFFFFLHLFSYLRKNESNKKKKNLNLVILEDSLKEFFAGVAVYIETKIGLKIYSFYADRIVVLCHF